MKRSLPAAFSAFLSLFIISAVAFFLLKTVSVKVFEELRSFLKETPDFPGEALNLVTYRVSSLVNGFSASDKVLSVGELFSSLSDAISQGLTQIISKMSSFLFNIAKNIPFLFIQIIVCVFTAYFLLKEGEVFFSFLHSFFGDSICEKVSRVRSAFLNVFLKYVKAQLIIGIIIFSILFVGMLLLKIKYAFLLALLTALVDVVPVFGTGTVLVPMAIYNFIAQNGTLAWGIIVLYGITLLSRQLAEPKIVGEKLGIHPFVTILSIYLGLRLLGVFGLIFGPLSAIFVKTLLFPGTENQNKNGECFT